MPINYYIFLSIALFSIGIVGVLTRRNAIIIFMCIELMLNAVNLMLVAFSKMHYNAALIAGDATTTAGTDGQLFVFFIMVVAAAEVSVGLSHYCYDVPEYTFSGCEFLEPVETLTGNI